jgi:hypothetical protein
MNRVRLLLFLFATALRALTALAVSLRADVALRDLALFYDGHLYLLVAKTFPALYSDVHAVFPGFPGPPTFLTGWFPVYPGLIRIVSLATDDLRLAALWVAWLAGGAAVVLFHELARDHVEHPAFAAFLFACLPTAWLVGGSLGLVESTFVCFLLAAVLATLRGKLGWAALFAALTALTQKSGFLVVPILLVLARPHRRAWVPCLGAIAGLASLQGYLWWRFGDPLVNLRTTSRVFSGGGELFAIPFSGFVRWMLAPDSPFRGLFWERKVAVVLETAPYLGTVAWVGLHRPPRALPLAAWSGGVLLFYASLSGATMPWSFYAFPRFVCMASPAATLLLCMSANLGVRRWHWAAAGLAAAVGFWWTVLDALASMDFWMRVWEPSHFAAARAVVGG